MARLQALGRGHGWRERGCRGGAERHRLAQRRSKAESGPVGCFARGGESERLGRHRGAVCAPRMRGPAPRLRLTWLNARAAVDAEANATVLGLSQVVITKIAEKDLRRLGTCTASSSAI